MEETRRGYKITIETEAVEELFIAEAEGAENRAVVESETLMIDEKPVPFLRTDEGIRIYYQQPQPDLISAARSYVDTQPEK